MTYTLYQQLPPAPEPVLRTVGHIDAKTAEQAIADAKRLPVFRTASGLARFPIVAEAQS